jgi:hypothetical protein
MGLSDMCLNDKVVALTLQASEIRRVHSGQLDLVAQRLQVAVLPSDMFQKACHRAWTCMVAEITEMLWDHCWQVVFIFATVQDLELLSLTIQLCTCEKSSSSGS